MNVKYDTERPDCVGERFDGGVAGCPHDYGYAKRPYVCDELGNSKLCADCWNRPVEGMTCREKLVMEHPQLINPTSPGGCIGCPTSFGYIPNQPEYCPRHLKNRGNDKDCTRCWDQEAVEKKLNEYGIVEPEVDDEPKPHILDSGERREFITGAVRDIQEGKGRCDLLPLDVIANYYLYMVKKLDVCHVLCDINDFVQTGNNDFLRKALKRSNVFTCPETMFLEVSKHFEEGCKKYGENNWRKGIPVHCYIDSAVRHYLKFLRGDTDEPHDRAFVWNILCAIWTCVHIPELNEYLKEENEE